MKVAFSLATLAALACTPAAFAQSLLLNGDFEQVNGGAEPKVTFPSWGEFESDSSLNTRNAAAEAYSSGIGGSISGHVRSGGSIGGGLRQTVSGTQPVKFSLDLQFAALSPETAAAADTRYFSLLVKHGNPDSVEQINLRGIKSGAIQVYNGSIWVLVPGLTMNFSTETGTVGVFDGETLAVNTLNITGDYDTTDGTPTVNYSITLNGVTATGISAFQAGAAANNGIGSVAFGGALAAKSFLVDNVTLTAIPEPTVATALVGGIGMLLLRRRRK